MDKMRVLKHHAFQEVTADLLNSIGTSLFQMSDGMAQAFIAGFQNTDHLIFQDLNVTPDTGLTVNLGLQGVFLYRLDQENSIVGVYKGTRADKLSPWTEEQLTFDPADPTNPRIDIIEAEIVEEDDPDYFETVQLFNNVTETSYAQNKYVRKVRNVKLYKKTGTPAASPVAPVATTGRFTLREIYIAASATSISPSNIIAQTFDPLFTNWTTNHGVIIFPSIYELIQFVKDQLAITRYAIFSKPGNYTFTVPSYISKMKYEIKGGGGSGMMANISPGSPAVGVDGQDSQIVGVAIAKGGKGCVQLSVPGQGGDSVLNSFNPNMIGYRGFSGEASQNEFGGKGGGRTGGDSPNVLFLPLISYVNPLGDTNSTDHDWYMITAAGSSFRVFFNVKTLEFSQTNIAFANFVSAVYMDESFYYFDAALGLLKVALDGSSVAINPSLVDVLGAQNDPNNPDLIVGMRAGKFVTINKEGVIISESTNAIPVPANTVYMVRWNTANKFLVVAYGSGIFEYDRSVDGPFNQLLDPTPGDISGASPLNTNRVTSVSSLVRYSDNLFLIVDKISGYEYKIKQLSLLSGTLIETYHQPSQHDVQLQSAFFNNGYLYLFERYVSGSPPYIPPFHGSQLVRFDSPWSIKNVRIAFQDSSQGPNFKSNSRAYGKSGGGGSGGYSWVSGQGGSGGGEGETVEGVFDCPPGTTLQLVVGRGGIPLSFGQQWAIPQPGSNPGCGGNGFVKLSW